MDRLAAQAPLTTMRRLLAILALFALIGAVAWQWHADETEAAAHRLTSLDPAAVSRIEVRLKGWPEQRFERREGRWTGDAAHVDEGRADELAALADTPVAEWRPASAFDAAKIGLAPPLATLVLDDVRVDFGEMTALGKRRYVRVGDRVAIVPAQALPRAPRTAALPTTATATR